jgi:4-hydroxythreonine-4-phosphate dehydrogenase
MTAETRPTLAFALGDAAGIGSELAAKMISDQAVRAAARLLVVGDRRQLQQGAAQAGLVLDIPDWDAGKLQDVALVERRNIDAGSVTTGMSSALTGRAALDNFASALRLSAAGASQATCFTPFNKYSMRLANPSYVDEIGFIQNVLGTTAEGAEFNVLDEFWNARVTSHVPLSAVAGLLTEELVLKRIRLTDDTMRGAGMPRPRIAVAALNPHAGDGGNFGHEDDAIIAPAVKRAAELQINVKGPLPADTVYLRAMRGEFDVVLSMYHDQGQIAMKLIGFDRGVTLVGGFPFWIATPAHGTAYDIAGQGKANPDATRNAILLAARLASQSDAAPAALDDQRAAIAAEIASGAEAAE